MHAYVLGQQALEPLQGLSQLFRNMPAGTAPGQDFSRQAAMQMFAEVGECTCKSKGRRRLQGWQAHRGQLQGPCFSYVTPPPSSRLKAPTCPVSLALMRKYVDSSMGDFTPLGTYTNEPSENTAELSAAK